MKLYKEIEIRKQADEPTLKMLDLWRSLSKEKTGVAVEVMIGNRREHKQLKDFDGELYTASPFVYNNKPFLVLYMDSLSNVNPLMITHEIGHWVLHLQGFYALKYSPNNNGNIEILLNSMAEHVPLYALQKSLGHEPETEIEARTLHNIKLFAKKVKSEKNITANVLMLTDDIINCSDSNRIALLNVLNKNYPKTSKLTKKIKVLSSSFNLLSADQNLLFREKVIEELDLGRGWCKVDNTEGLISLVNKTQNKKGSA